ncbi:hypothetical protein [Georgenia sp. AZ-5]|uniref:hypothetical protein n=1 Tax=Georgenia sp. AZ-5 TaxID=3367526 RepID=UPI0037542F34
MFKVTDTTCEVCESARAGGTLTITGPAGRITEAACLECASNARATMTRCHVSFVPTLAVVA